ncbi:MAG: 5'/3'-nucleotidase SurE [Phycisphaerae bacterium]|nr:5'/3'-nucleotidase SurE [Phycisphaerae bacterium]
MRILLSNDDGIAAPGLAALRATAADLGEVTVVAPDSPQSAAGHGITVRRSLTVRTAPLAAVGDAPPGEGLSVDGRPADCVRLAARHLMDAMPQLVLSGINAGANVGVNVFYSGTVAAAAEGAMLGIPAVAVSAEVADGEVDFARAGRLARWALERLVAIGLRAGEIVNVNIPAGPGRPRGLRVVRQSTAEIEDVYHLERGADGASRYRLGPDYRFIGHIDDDVTCLYEGYVTVTPLHVDMTSHARLADLAAADWGDPPT